MNKNIFIVFILFYCSINTICSQEKLSLKKIKQHAYEEMSFKGIFKKADKKFDQRLPGKDGITLKGDLTFIANSVTNRRIGTDVKTANIPYNGGDNNNSFSIEYIDIDDDEGIIGNASTFSSSKSKLDLPGCSEVVWAGLYWSGIYPYKSATDRVPPTDKIEEIKFRLPGQEYKDVTGEIIYNFSPTLNRRPYACFKEMTDEVKALSNPNGDYYAANIKATVGGACCGGTSAGWIMVVIYKNQTKSSKHFSVFDGFTSIQHKEPPVVIEYNKGFKTVPIGPDPKNPAPVRASMLVGTVEGDLNLKQDRFEIENTAGVFQPQSNSLNPATNFFNSSITINNAHLAGRVPNGTNTLGFDADLFEISNPDNSVLGNDQTSVKIQFVTDQDSYWTFLNAFAVEVIEPDIQLVKTIDDGVKGRDISGTPLDFGDDLWYNINFQNIGSDDAINTIITDELPKNVDLIPGDIDLPPGVVLLSYTPPMAPKFRGVLVFGVDNSLVKQKKTSGDHDIRFHVKVVSDCSQLRDVCSNVIANQAFAAYTGLRGGVKIDDAPSVSGINACDFGIAGASNFLIDTSGCSFTTDVEFCGASIELSAGSGFASYTWKDDKGKIVGNTQKITINALGTYTVEKVNPPGVLAACVAADEIFNVIPMSSMANPLIAFEDEHEICSADSVTRTSEIFLCATGDSKTLSAGVSAPTVVRWQKLKSTCIPDPLSDCPIFDDACWVDVSTNPNNPTRSFSESGRYRLLLETTSSGGGVCPQPFYFRIFKPNITPIYEKKDIICSTPGSIKVNGVPSGYKYAFVIEGSGKPKDSEYQTSNVFDAGSTANNYEVYIKNDTTGCVFGPKKISINKIDLKVKITLSEIKCFGDKGIIEVKIDSKLPAGTLYEYEVLKGGVQIATSRTDDKVENFEVNSSETYIVNVTTDDCSFKSGNLTFKVPDPLKFKATNNKDVSCTDGKIKLFAEGGTKGATGYRYAIWTYNPAATATATAILSSDAKTYFIDTDYTVLVGAEGDYEFIVIDNNNCRKISNLVSVKLEDPLKFKAVLTNPTCSGTKDGTITVNTIDPPGLLGYTLEYRINGGVYQTSNKFKDLEEIVGGYNVDIKATKKGFSCNYSILNLDIISPKTINGGDAKTTHLSCASSGAVNLGSIIFTPPSSGGTGVYKYYYRKKGSTSFIVLPVGTLTVDVSDGEYEVKIEDTNRCVGFTDTVKVNPLPTKPTLKDDIVYNCDGSGNITITPNPLPVTGKYNYTLSNTTGVLDTNDSGVFKNQVVGSYKITVAYGSSCETDILVNVLDDKKFKASAVGAKLSCNGGTDGSVEITAVNFGTSFDYNINGTGWVIGNATTNTSSPLKVTPVGVKALGFGDHVIQIRPTGATIGTCVISKKITITQPEEVIIDKVLENKPVTCVPNTGATLVPSAKGGNGPTYTYELFDDLGVSQGVTTTEFINVTAGDYTIIATDSSTKCKSKPFTVKVTDKNAINFTAKALCYDGTDGVINVNVTKGNGNYEFKLDSGIWFTADVTSPNDFRFSGLSANKTYTITVKDQRGCTDTSSIKINPELTATADETFINCNTSSGQIKVFPVGGSGTGYEFSVVPNGNPAGTFSNTNPIVTGLTANTYDVYVKDSENCEYIIEDVVIGVTENPTMNVKASEPTCFGGKGTVKVDLDKGQIPYTVKIFNASGTVSQTQITNTDSVSFFGLSADTYTVTMSDKNGCPTPINSTNVTLVELPEIDAGVSVVLPVDCKPYVGNESDFGFKYTLPVLLTSVSLPYIVQVRDEAGIWFNENGTNEFRRVPPETIVSPAVRIIHKDPVSGVETEVCIKVLDDFKTTFNLNSLVRLISYDGARCEDGMKIRVGGSGGSGTYGFAIDAVPSTIAGWNVTGTDFIDYTGLTPGRTYIFYVRDMVSGCVEQQEGVFNPDMSTDRIPITPKVITEGCGIGSGKIEFSVDNSDANVTGGTASWYIYDVTKTLSVPLSLNAEEVGVVPTGTNFTITSGVPLSAGTYYLILEEPGAIPACTWASGDVEIKDGEPIKGDLDRFRNITCNLNGIININNVRGGAPGYTFAVNVFETGDPTNVVSSTDYSVVSNSISVPYAAVPAGVSSLTVNVEVTDVKNCKKLLTQDLLVSELPSITNVVPNSCGANKTIKLTTTGGLAPYEYSVNSGTFSSPTKTDFLVEKLTPGSYDIVVRDANGCTNTVKGIVIQDTLDFELKLTDNIDCITPVATEASFEINMTSGSGRYEYEISRDNSGAPIVVVARGTLVSPFKTSTPDTYKVTVYDLAETPNCSVTKTIKIADPVLPDFTASGVDAICDGDTSGSIKITPLSGVTPVTYTATNALGIIVGKWDVTTSSIIDLPEGVYSVTGIGDNKCSFISPTKITIKDFDPINVPDITINNFDCSGETNFTNLATIEFDSNKITGGSGSYTIDLYKVVAGGDVKITSGISISTGIYTYTISDESGGDYYVKVIDSKGCGGDLNRSKIEMLPAFEKLIDIKATQNEAISCTNGGEVIDIVFTSSLPVTGAEITIKNNTGVVVETIIGVNSGIKVTSSTSTTSSPFRLIPGIYTIDVKHPSTKCVVSTSYEVKSVVNHIVDVQQTKSIACVGSYTAVAEIVFNTSTPYGGEYTYTIYDVTSGLEATLGTGSPTLNPGKAPNGNIPFVIEGLSAGEYYVEVVMTDFPECTRRTPNFKIEEPKIALDFSYETNLISCIANDSGEIKIKATGGWEGYEYKLVNNTTSTIVQNYSNDPIIKGLIAGDYTITVRDSEKCEKSRALTLSPPEAFVATHTIVKEISCQGDSTAVVRLDVTSGGQGMPPVYLYSLTDVDAGTPESVKQTSNEFRNLSEGNYIITVYDEYSCAEIFPIYIPEPTKVKAEGKIISNITCTNPKAIIEISGLDGTGAYTYLYSDDGGATLNTLTTNTISVSAGKYEVYVKDGNKCISDPFFVTIDELEPLDVSLNTSSAVISCTGNANAVLSATVKGGLGDYEYELLDNDSGKVIKGPQKSNSFSNIGPGIYSIKVTSKDCDKTTKPFEVKDPPLLEVKGEPTHISCNGEVDGIITINAKGGTGDYVYEIDTRPGRFQTENKFNNLSAGKYNVTVQDDKGCFKVVEVTIKEPKIIVASIDITSIQEQLCSDDPKPSFAVDISGGTPPYTLGLSDGSPAITLGLTDTRHTFTNLKAGQFYVVFIKDSKDCDLPSNLNIQLEETVNLEFEAGVTYKCDETAVITGTVANLYKDQVIYTLSGPESDTNDTGIFNVTAIGSYTLKVEHIKASGKPSCIKVINDLEVKDISPLELLVDDSKVNTLIASATGGIPPYEYSIDGSPFSLENEFIITETRDYVIRVRDARQCEEMITVAGEFITIEVPNLFTPNDDGKNDYWYPIKVQDYHDLKVYIYDRYGRFINEYRGVQQGWDGTYEGKPLPSGDYWYRLEFKEITNRDKELMGHFTLYRY